MANSTAETLQKLVQDKVASGKTTNEAIADICSAVDDMIALPGVVAGLEAVENGSQVELDNEFIESFEGRIRSKLNT